MKDKKINTNKLMISSFVYIVVFFLFVVLALSLGYRTLIDYDATPGVAISKFIENRNINEEVILPVRGTIYDKSGNVLAEEVASYTVIAYLSQNRGNTRDGKPRYVVDKEKTAKELSKLISTKYERILELLNRDAYQVEFGTGGKNLSQLEMEAIKALDLPGIDFIKSIKRYYPNGDFASYLLGYTKNKTLEDGNTYMVGELGIEGYFNTELTGKSGYIKYEKDGRGNRIANSNEYKEDAVDGNSIYLTIDNSIQLFIENAVKKAEAESKSEWIIMGVMDAKTGAILGYSSTPSFDPNIRNIKNYMDPLVSYAYEPGSTMKTFSYMCAIDSGKYKGNEKFMSGSKTYVSDRDKNDTVTIKDWNDGKGWGSITYDYGFAMSSNIGVANMLETFINKSELRACYQKYGFGKKTGISLGGELAGNINFKYDIEAAIAGYGQGIMVSPIQMLQGLSIVGNNGVMLKPYIVSKIVDSSGQTISEYGKEELGRVASEATIAKIKELLRSVISTDINGGTGYAYRMEGYDLIGKTGTASIFEKGKYLVGNGDYIYSFAGLYPGEESEIIIYMAIKKPKDGANYIAPRVKEVITNTSKYLSIEDRKKVSDNFTMGEYLNSLVVPSKKELSDNGIRVITLGEGNKVINQYPLKGVILNKDDLAVLLTSDYKKTMIDFTGMSYKEVKNILDLMGVTYELKGYGYATSQSVEVGKIIDTKVIVEFKGLY